MLPQVLGQPELHSKFGAIQSCRVRLCRIDRQTDRQIVLGGWTDIQSRGLSELRDLIMGM